MAKRCPKCKTENVRTETYLGATVLICNECSFDEREALEELPSKEKQRYKAVYKTGGSRRTQKP